MRSTKPPTKKPSLSKKKQEEYDKLKSESKRACGHWKHWKFRIHWKNGIYRDTETRC